MEEEGGREGDREGGREIGREGGGSETDGSQIYAERQTGKHKEDRERQGGREGRGRN